MSDDASDVAEVTAIVCDDDRIARSVITGLIEERQGVVLAETDHALDATGLIERFRPTLVVVDMALQIGHGNDITEWLAGQDLACQVVVFTAFADMARHVAGVPIRVVEKPDFGQLEVALDAAIEDVRSAGILKNRRRAVRDVEPARLDDDGMVPIDDFYRDLADARPGDALLAIDVGVDDVHSVAQALRTSIRVQDRVALRKHTLVVLLVGGGDEGPRAVLGRVAATHPEHAAAARTTTIGDGDAPLDVLTAVSAR